MKSRDELRLEAIDNYLFAVMAETREWSNIHAKRILSALQAFDEPKNIIETTLATGEIIRYQPCEPLEVEIVELFKGKKFGVVYELSVVKFYSTKQEAIDFCKRHGLKITDELQTKEG